MSSWGPLASSGGPLPPEMCNARTSPLWPRLRAHRGSRWRGRSWSRARLRHCAPKEPAPPFRTRASGPRCRWWGRCRGHLLNRSYAPTTRQIPRRLRWWCRRMTRGCRHTRSAPSPRARPRPGPPCRLLPRARCSGICARATCREPLGQIRPGGRPSRHRWKQQRQTRTQGAPCGRRASGGRL